MLTLSKPFLCVRFDYSSLFSFLFFVLVIYTVFPVTQIYRKLPERNQFSNILGRFICSMMLASCIIHTVGRGILNPYFIKTPYLYCPPYLLPPTGNVNKHNTHTHTHTHTHTNTHTPNTQRKVTLERPS